MKKYMVLSFLVVLNIAVIANESLPKSETVLNKGKIEFTQEEQQLAEKVAGLFVNFSYREDIFLKKIIFSACGYSKDNRKNSFDPALYPECKDTLEFLKKYSEERKKLSEQVYLCKKQLSQAS